MQLNGKNIEVIVQAGGRGSRLRHFTWNKPKCLVSYNGKPVIYHLFDYLNKANLILRRVPCGGVMWWWIFD